MELVKSTQSTLATTNLRLHKVVSNSLAVMEALPAGDRAKDICDLDLCHDVLPTQRSLGVYWALAKDSFTFQVSLREKPFARRGVLSTTNSVYDPLGSWHQCYWRASYCYDNSSSWETRKATTTLLGGTTLFQRV